jgi:hypothetical protein
MIMVVKHKTFAYRKRWIRSELMEICVIQNAQHNAYPMNFIVKITWIIMIAPSPRHAKYPRRLESTLHHALQRVQRFVMLLKRYVPDLKTQMLVTDQTRVSNSK